jgi:hypothetical protein
MIKWQNICNNSILSFDSWGVMDAGPFLKTLVALNLKSRNERKSQPHCYLCLYIYIYNNTACLYLPLSLSLFLQLLLEFNKVPPNVAIILHRAQNGSFVMSGHSIICSMGLPWIIIIPNKPAKFHTLQ